jgi:curved DNA-binding protein CbpA
MLTYRRPLGRGDQYDKAILTNSSHSVIWAMGPVNSKGEVSYHTKRITQNLKLEFGRNPQWNCPIAGQPNRSKQPSKNQEPKSAPKAAQPWFVPPIQVKKRPS